MRYAKARGQLTVRADSGFYTHTIVVACRDKSVRFSITVRQHQSVRNIIEAIPEADWTPIPYWMEGAAWLAVQVMAHNLARWTCRIGLGEPLATTNTLRRRFFSLAGRLARSARRLTLHLPQGWPWRNQFSSALERLRALPLPS